MARPALAVPQTYAALRRAVEVTVFVGRQKIEDAWVRTYHETGRLIHEHILLNKDRAGYGAKVFDKLAADTGISKRTLHECAQFARCFPIVRISAQLTRSHYIVLCQVADPDQRQQLLLQAVKHNWTVAELVERVRPLNAALAGASASDAPANIVPPRLLTPRRGTPGICRVLEARDRLVADMGFAFCRNLPAAAGFKAGGFVRVAGDKISPAPDATKADLFTYPAEVLKVVDGDTLWVEVYLLPDHWVRQKLRLRDLDCPELATAAGKSAKRFVESLFAEARGVTICTTKPDKYDRYLADVFLTTTAGEVYLNNELLKTGHAVRKGDYAPTDWD
ncbi:MAG: thermonuclease family protein [Opitutaceae bacterium]|nr:thermonuclease family protein [Opitutaceae bacterium]